MPRHTKNKKFENDNSFYWLATCIAGILEQNKDGSTQRQQVEELFQAERLFKEEILKYKYSTTVYRKFIEKIRYIDRNILYAKVYFRESGERFSAEITKCFKEEDPEALKKYSINFNLIQFIAENWRGPLGPKAEKLYQRVKKARKILMENNLPLVINEAKKFFRKVPRSDLTLIDMISTSAMGLASAIDKYSGDKNGEYSEVFRSVILGRASGNLIRDYSQTALHFYPSDRKVLYRANSIRGRQGITDIVELTNAINESFKQDIREGKSAPTEKIEPSYLFNLLNAASITSIENTADENGFTVYDFTPSESKNIEESLIQEETCDKIGKLINKLPILYRKVLKLKGVNFA
jgi:DNA-directed RNA polymerase specialized sigma subunit